MAFTLTDVALVLFTACNTARVFAYFPQMVKIGRDTQGASAISCATWVLFGVSNLSTVAYAVFVLSDWRMTAVFAANTMCCIAIVGMTAWKRATFRMMRNGLDGPLPPLGRRDFANAPVNAAGRHPS
ncbi:hypothetical protein [Microvirga splendida]|uniref:Uncharacterized protein n=1 Tax=Microvirga splendida TaxID=2795727 RepID=A0ABS0XWA2_9HYPH|nr:hypothetical protein [Microvirga splendida]MBJ6124318.1 hypothetical protein [Microvirga splendida]